MSEADLHLSHTLSHTHTHKRVSTHVCTFVHTCRGRRDEGRKVRDEREESRTKSVCAKLQPIPVRLDSTGLRVSINLVLDTQPVAGFIPLSYPPDSQNLLSFLFQEVNSCSLRQRGELFKDLFTAGCKQYNS